jgi:excisionase family DNA binding protein
MEQIYIITDAQLRKLMTETLDEYRRRDEQKRLEGGSEEYLGSQQVCELLGVSSRTFQRYRDEHRIAFIQRGRKIYVKRSDLDAFQEANRIEAR